MDNRLLLIVYRYVRSKRLVHLKYGCRQPPKEHTMQNEYHKCQSQDSAMRNPSGTMIFNVQAQMLNLLRIPIQESRYGNKIGHHPVDIVMISYACRWVRILMNRNAGLWCPEQRQPRPTCQRKAARDLQWAHMRAHAHFGTGSGGERIAASGTRPPSLSGALPTCAMAICMRMCMACRTPLATAEAHFPCE